MYVLKSKDFLQKYWVYLPQNTNRQLIKVLSTKYPHGKCTKLLFLFLDFFFYFRKMVSIQFNECYFL